MTSRLFVVGLTFAVFAASCGGSVAETEAATGDPDLWTVGPDLIECEGFVVQDCMLVRAETDLNWQLHFDPIGGFTFEPGVTSIIEVTQTEIEDPPEDGSSIQVDLVRIVEQTESFEPDLERWLLGPDVFTCFFDGNGTDYRLAKRDTGSWERLRRPIVGLESAAGTRYELDVIVPTSREPELVDVAASEAVEPLDIDGTTTWEVLAQTSFHCRQEPAGLGTTIVQVRTMPNAEPRLLAAPTGFEPDYFTRYEIEVAPVPGGGFELVEIVASELT